MSDEVGEIFASVAAAYGQCRSYRDEGNVTKTYFMPLKRTDLQPFSTRFVRPDGFRFEFRKRRGEYEWDQYVVWLEDNLASTWWDALRRNERHPLPLAIARATGVSGGSASRVPRLLMPDVIESRGLESEEARVIDVPEASLVNCIVVERNYGSDAKEQIWIDRATWLIRKVVVPRFVLPRAPLPLEWSNDLDKARQERVAEILAARRESPVEVESVTTYDAAFDVAIEPEELRFVPPEE